MAYELIWENKGIRIRFYGEASWWDLEHYKQELFADPRFDSLRYQIFDASDLISIKVDEKDAVRGAHLDRASAKFHRSACRIAMVTDKPEVAALGREYASALQVPLWDCKQFATLAEALAWVQVD